MDQQEIISIIVEYLKSFPIERIGVFGSFARGELRPGSDIDILVSYREPVDLLTLSRMHRELSALLGRKVDIVSEKFLHPRLKEAIEKDLKILAA